MRAKPLDREVPPLNQTSNPILWSAHSVWVTQ
jgi:hypothetical protein